MKLLLILLLICCLDVKAHSQTYLTPSIGISNNLYFVAGIGFNEQLWHRIELTQEMIDIANVKSGANFGGKMGVSIHRFNQFSITPAIGYYYHYFSSDKNEFTKGKNYWSEAFSIKGEASKWFIEAGIIKNEFNLRIGLKLKL